MIVDKLEPDKLVRRLSRKVEVARASLVGTGYCDYLTAAHDGHLITVERKEVHDLANSFDRLEGQLKRAVETVGDDGEVILLREGIIVPAGNKSTLFYYRDERGNFHKNTTKDIPYTFFEAMVYRYEKLGIAVYDTSCLEASADLLAIIELKSKDPEYVRYKQYIRAKAPVPIEDPYVQLLVNIGLGTKTSEALIKKFGSPWAVLSATEDELCEVDGIGKGTVEKLYTKLGRNCA